MDPNFWRGLFYGLLITAPIWGAVGLAWLFVYKLLHP